MKRIVIDGITINTYLKFSKVLIEITSDSSPEVSTVTKNIVDYQMRGRYITLKGLDGNINAPVRLLKMGSLVL